MFLRKILASSLQKNLFSHGRLRPNLNQLPWITKISQKFTSNEKPEKPEKPEKVYQKIVIEEKDLEWQQVKGGGPGGQATNKTNNCIILKHKPSGILVKCHQSRDTETNKHYAIKTLKEKLDIMINGDLSKRNQKIDKAKKQKDRRRRKSEQKHAVDGNNLNANPVEKEATGDVN